MRILSPVIAIILAVAATLPAFAESTPAGSSHIASLRCVQFAIVREHHHNPAGWPTDCDSALWPQSKKG
jgi:hypothetical protein